MAKVRSFISAKGSGGDAGRLDHVRGDVTVVRALELGVQLPRDDADPDLVLGLVRRQHSVGKRRDGESYHQVQRNQQAKRQFQVVIPQVARNMSSDSSIRDMTAS